MQAYSANQITVAASAYKKIYWLFETGAYYWSTKTVLSSVWDSQAYSFKVLPESFNGIKLSRNKTEEDMFAPSTADFTIHNKGNALDSADFEGDLVTIRLVVSDGTLTEQLGVWIFNVESCKDVNQTLEFECVDPITYISESEYPKNKLVSTIFPNVEDRKDALCLPEVFGTAYIPIRSIFQDDSSGPERYYALGVEGRIFDIEEIRTPRDANAGKTVWPSTEYTFYQSTLDAYGESSLDENYEVFQALVHDSDSDSALDSNIHWGTGDGICDLPTKFSRTDGIHPLTNPADVIAYILEDAGISSGLIDTGGGSSFETAGTTYDGWSLEFNGGLYTPQPFNKLLAMLLNSCHSCLRITDKIELHVLDNTSKKTITTSEVLNTQQSGYGSFKRNLITKEKTDSGNIAFQPDVDDGESQDELVRYVVPTSLSTVNTANSTLEIPLISDSEQAQKVGILYYQLKLLGEEEIGFDSKGALIALQPHDFITVNSTRYGGNYLIIIDEMSINKDMSISFNTIKFSDTISNWTDLSPAALVVSSDVSATAYRAVVAGPDATVGSGIIPNAIPGRLRLGSITTGSILLDPVAPVIELTEASVARVMIGDLGTSEYGIEIYNADNNLVMRIGDDVATDSFAGWGISNTAISITNAVLHSSGYASFGSTPPTGYGNNVGAWIGYDSAAKMSLYSDANNYLQWDGSKLLIKAANFTLDASGNLTATNVDLTGTISATGGTFGGWILGSDRLYSHGSGRRIELDSGDGRISIFSGDSSSGDLAKVIMGFLDDKVRNGATGTATTGTNNTTLIDSTKNWEESQSLDSSGADSSGSTNEGGMVGLYLHYTSGPASGESKIIIWNESDRIKTGAFSGTPVAGNSYEVRYGTNDYGFWAAPGDQLWIDGNVEYKSGDWIIHHDSSYQVLNGAGTTIIKIGKDEIQTSGIGTTAGGILLDTTGTGIIDTAGTGGPQGNYVSGLFIYDHNGDQVSRFHDGGARIGGATNAENYFEYDAETGIFLFSSNSPNAVTIGRGGDLALINDSEDPAKLVFKGSNIVAQIFCDNSFSLEISPDFTAMDSPQVVRFEVMEFDSMVFNTYKGGLYHQAWRDFDDDPDVYNALTFAINSYQTSFQVSLADPEGSSYDNRSFGALRSPSEGLYYRLQFEDEKWLQLYEISSSGTVSTQAGYIEVKIDSSTRYIPAYTTKT